MCKAVIKGLYGHKPYAAAPATLSEEDDAPAAPVEVTEADPCAWRRDKDALLVHMLNSYATLPTRQTPGSAGLDLSSCGEIIVPAKGSALVQTGCAFTFPSGVYGRIAPRSGLAVKHMLDVGAGVIDPDFSGEVRVMLFNHSDYEFRVRPGDRIAQLILEKVMIVDAKITVKQPDVTVRGVNGFGSTGGYPAGPAIGLSGDPVPPMPRSSKASGHQPNLQGIPTFYACVARPVTKKEQAGNDKARAALLKEWTKLRKLGCWDESKVREWKKVAAEARANGQTVHVGRIFDICVEKNHELPEDDPNRKYKGIVVFEGCFVRDQSNHWAMFSEATSCPATMAAGKMCDAYGMLPGHALQVSDGESAYTQAKLLGPTTWVRIPKDQWPQAWVDAGYDDPVCPLILALYGHPDAGTFWEKHCEARLIEVGFIRVPEWPSVFYHPKYKLFLVVYVDDFKMGGPSANLSIGWDLIGRVITMELPGMLKRYLGCEHEFAAADVQGFFDPRTAWTVDHPPSKEMPDIRFGEKRLRADEVKFDPARVKIIKYNEACFMEACVDRYKELCLPKYPRPLVKAETPFLDESKPEFDENPINPEVDQLFGQPSPCPTDVIAEQPGVLGDAAAAVLMKILYGARMGRYDLIRPVQALASRITKWNRLCDKKLHRIVSYINSTLDLHLYGWVCDKPSDIEIVAYCDADLAGDRTDSKSTSGVLICLVGPRTYVPITAVSKKQTSVSKSTPEAEIVALDHGVAKEGMPLAQLWQFAIGQGTGKPVTVNCMEDNEAACRIIITGNNPNMRYMSRTQRIDISWLNEVYNEQIFRFVACPSHYQGADILTKACVDKVTWGRNLQTLGMFNPGFLEKFISHPTLPVVKPAAPVLPPIRGVRMETDQNSFFNKFIQLAESSYMVFDIVEDRSNVCDARNIFVDSELGITPEPRFGRWLTYFVRPANLCPVIPRRGTIEGSKPNILLCRYSSLIDASTRGNWSKIRRARDQVEQCQSCLNDLIEHALNTKFSVGIFIQPNTWIANRNILVRLGVNRYSRVVHYCSCLVNKDHVHALTLICISRHVNSFPVFKCNRMYRTTRVDPLVHDLVVKYVARAALQTVSS